MKDNLPKTYPEIKVYLAWGLTRLSRKERAESLKICFVAIMALLFETEKEMTPEDLERWRKADEGADYRGYNPKATEESDKAIVDWMRRSYPQMAAVLDLGIIIHEAIRLKGFFREYGFTTNDEWERATDNSVYLSFLARSTGYELVKKEGE